MPCLFILSRASRNYTDYVCVCAHKPQTTHTCTPAHDRRDLRRDLTASRACACACMCARARNRGAQTGQLDIYHVRMFYIQCISCVCGVRAHGPLLLRVCVYICSHATRTTPAPPIYISFSHTCRIYGRPGERSE